MLSFVLGPTPLEEQLPGHHECLYPACLSHQGATQDSSPKGVGEGLEVMQGCNVFVRKFFLRLL